MEPTFILLCLQRKLHAVYLKEILFLKACGKYCILHTDSKKIKLAKGISELSQKLPVQKFSRIHRSYLVAWEKVKKITAKRIHIGNETIPLTRSGRKMILQLLGL